MKKICVYLFTMLCLMLALSGCAELKALEDAVGPIVEEQMVGAQEGNLDEVRESEMTEGLNVEEDGTYSSRDQVALYIHTFGELPDNFITKKDAESLGWQSKKGNLDEVAPGMSIGGSRFGNYENKLPDGDYKECDINYTGGYRGAERIIYSAEGDIYYTDDHYETFTKLY